jgi:integrase
MSATGFRRQLADVAATLPFPAHPHMLRHACGFALAHARHDTRAIQEWLGHRNIQDSTHRSNDSGSGGSAFSGPFYRLDPHSSTILMPR